jgi:DNA invertase Pin-like site-specific DNA recombinase
MAYEPGDVDRAQKERDDRIRELLAQGLSYREIAASEVSYVRQARQRRDDRIRELHAAEWTQAEIASEVGCSRGTVMRAVNGPEHRYVNG